MPGFNSFAALQFRRTLPWYVLLNLLMFLLGFLGNILAGNRLGEDALAGVGLAMPFIGLGNFLVSLLGAGVGINYSRRRGELDAEGAETVFMQGIWTILFVGSISGLFTYFSRDVYLSLMKPSPEVLKYALDYWRQLPLMVAVVPVTALLLNCCYCDGDSRLPPLSCVANLMVNLAVSWSMLNAGTGVVACSTGFLCGQLAMVLILAGHFFRRTNTFRLRWRFRLSDSRLILTVSLGDALGFLETAVIYTVLGKVAVDSLGPSALVLLPVFEFVSGFCDYTCGFATSLQPLAGVYCAEGNVRSVRSVTDVAQQLLAAFTLAVAAVFLLFPWLVVRAVGITDPSLALQADAVVRYTALAILPGTWFNLMNNYYQFIGRGALSVGMTVFHWLLMPLALLFVYSGVGGGPFWSWYAVECWSSFVLFSLFLLLRFGRPMYPLLLDRRREAAISVFDLRLSELAIVRTAEAVSRKLAERGIEPARTVRASLLVEETLMVVKERNEGRVINAEVTLDLNDGLLLTIRDDGEIFDITDVDAKIRNLRTYIVASVMQRQSMKANLITTGFNRNVYRL